MKIYWNKRNMIDDIFFPLLWKWKTKVVERFYTWVKWHAVIKDITKVLDIDNRGHVNPIQDEWLLRCFSEALVQRQRYIKPLKCSVFNYFKNTLLLMCLFVSLKTAGGLFCTFEHSRRVLLKYGLIFLFFSTTVNRFYIRGSQIGFLILRFKKSNLILWYLCYNAWEPLRSLAVHYWPLVVMWFFFFKYQYNIP